jgi:pimeloyl-ACP methyl ester carboxylesterase
MKFFQVTYFDYEYNLKFKGKKMTQREKITIGLVSIILVFGAYFLLTDDTGIRYLFDSKAFHYQTARTMGHSIYQGAGSGEVLSIINKIKNEDEESWYIHWQEIASRMENLAESSDDNISKGNAYLRASNYFRTGEFFLHPKDDRRLSIYLKSVDTFQKGIKFLGLEHKTYYLPYETGQMRNYYFPGHKDKPLIMICGGFDSTNEESFFFMAYGLIHRGFPVLMFEGPGQSSVLREHQIQFTPDWHKVVAKTIDGVIEQDSSLQVRKKVLLGISFGGILAGRAAAYEKRLDAVALHGAPYDMVAGALFQMPAIARWAYENDFKNSLNLLSAIKLRFDLTLRWGLRNGIWSIGGNNTYEFLKAATPYTLKDVQEKITCPILVFYGEKDIYVSDGYQNVMFEQAFKNAKSYTLNVFKEEDGSAEHCQIGAAEQATMVFIKWLNNSAL